MDIAAIMNTVIKNGGMSSLQLAAQAASLPTELQKGTGKSVTSKDTTPECRPAVLIGKDIGFNGSTVSVKA